MVEPRDYISFVQFGIDSPMSGSAVTRHIAKYAAGTSIDES